MPVLEAKRNDTEKKDWLKGRGKYVSGYCNNINKPAQCEGTKPKTPSGKALPTCPMWLECPCACHYNVDQMFKITGLERQYIPNPEYVPERDEFVLPDVPDPIGLGVALEDGGMIDRPEDERRAHAAGTPVLTPLVERRTPTGRAARGGLEAQVWEACSTLGVEPITPKAVAEFIADKYHVPTPSTGAINAVWNRWEKLGYCEQAKKPNRFVKFTGSGTWEELTRLKTSTKSAEKRAKSAAMRGFR